LQSKAPEESETEILWMERIAQGDEEAFRCLVTRYEKQILNLAYRYCGDAQASQDLVQEIFLKVYRSAGRWKPGARFSTWLFRVAVNHCLNDQRDRKREPVVSANGIQTERYQGFEWGVRARGGHTSESAEADWRKREIASRVRKAILALPPRQRMAVILHRYCGLSYKKIAERMECSQGAVESLLVRAVENLRGALGDLF
jgi:RNA polymerase sigma-70 factor (ECF subfamily)